MKTSVIVLSLVASANAFTAPSMVHSSRPALVTSLRATTPEKNGEQGLIEEAMISSEIMESNFASSSDFPLAQTAIAASLWAASAEIASAAGPDWGIFEGRTLSLAHPVFMGGLFIYSVYTAFLGFQWRRQRTIGDEISSLKKTMPDMGGASSVAEAVAIAQEQGEQDKIATLQASAGTQAEIEALQQERKDLAAASPRDKHFAQGAILAFSGTLFAIEGPLNTYARTGKLFPGPHLYVGAALVVIWSLAVGTIPAMQKGNDTARSIHIGANAAGLAFFAWQVQSGIPILLKVLQFTKWP